MGNAKIRLFFFNNINIHGHWVILFRIFYRSKFNH